MKTSMAWVTLLLSLGMPKSLAVPPLVSGDVPTADKQTFELYTGWLYESDGGSIHREVPTMELNYGVSDRQEITLQMAWLSERGESGMGDVIVGTKYVLLQETRARPGIAASFELKLPVASVSRGLGNGAYDEDFLLRMQKTWGHFTGMANAGCTVLGKPKIDEGMQRDAVWFASLAQRYALTEKTSLLSEIYMETSEERGGPTRLAANIGFETEIAHDLTLQAAVGRSLRESGEGGPELRAYVGLHWAFDAPWKRGANKVGIDGKRND